MNAKRVYRLYDQEELKVRSVERKKISRRQRVPQSIAAAPNQCWSADFVSDKLVDGRFYRILTVVDQFTRECVALEADRSMHGTHVTAALTRALEERGTVPKSITLDNGSEFTGRALEVWAIRHGVQLCFIRPGRPVENRFIESFNGRLRDECLNVEWFSSQREARDGLARWRQHYNRLRSHSALGDCSPTSFAAAYRAAAERFALIRVDTANGAPRQGFAAPAKNAALDPVLRLSENREYQGEAHFENAHIRDPLLSLYSGSQPRQSRSREP